MCVVGERFCCFGFFYFVMFEFEDGEGYVGCFFVWMLKGCELVIVLLLFDEVLV